MMTNPTGSASIIKERVFAAIRGAIIADAASMSTHWIYDPNEMMKTVTSIEAPEFREPPAPKYYSSEDYPGHYGSGMLSPYGEQLLFVTEYVASTMTEEFTGESMSHAMLDWAERFGGRPDEATKTFAKNMKKEDDSGKWPNCGADDDQAHIYMKIVPLVCRFAGSSELVDKVTQAIKVHQNNPKAIAFGIVSARILEAVLLGAPLAEALATVESNLEKDLESSSFRKDVVDAFARGKKGGHEITKSNSDILLEVSHEVMKGKEDSPFYDLSGRSCALPGSFIGPIALFYKSTLVNNKKESATDAFISAVRENILASGDTCSRGVFVGAVMAAAGTPADATGHGIIPSEWVKKADQDTMKKVEHAAETITKHIAY